MELQSLPETIRNLIEQAGGLGLRGAFTYIGANRLAYRCPEPTGECRPDHPSGVTIEEGVGFLRFGVGLSCFVNGKPGRSWMLIIAYEPDDTYTVWLVEGHANRKPDTMVLACRRDVYCDMLQSTIEAVYDEAIVAHNNGFIPLGTR